MSKIKGKDTKPEILVRKFLFSKGLRYRLHDKKLPGKPDLVFPKYKKAVFINGCYWHGHDNCKYFVPPKTNTQWWLDKINATKERDRKKVAELEELGWDVIIIWGCELKPKKRENTLVSLLSKLFESDDENKIY